MSSINPVHQLRAGTSFRARISKWPPPGSVLGRMPSRLRGSLVLASTQKTASILVFSLCYVHSTTVWSSQSLVKGSTCEGLAARARLPWSAARSIEGLERVWPSNSIQFEDPYFSTNFARFFFTIPESASSLWSAGSCCIDLPLTSMSPSSRRLRFFLANEDVSSSSV